MFTKLNMIDNQLVMTNYIEWRNDDVISDVTANQFRLGFSIFRTCEYFNLISLHPMFTKLDMIDNRLVLTNYIEWRYDDVISDVTADQFRLRFSIFRTCEYIYLISGHLMFTKLYMIDTQVVLMNSIEWCHDDVISDVRADQFQLELSIFRTCEYNNLISLHLMFTKLDMINNQLVLMNLIKWHHDDVISDAAVDRFWLYFAYFELVITITY